VRLESGLRLGPYEVLGAVAALNHPGVLSLHDVGDADGVSFMINNGNGQRIPTK
jgi:hypothetical protein